MTAGFTSSNNSSGQTIFRANSTSTAGAVCRDEWDYVNGYYEGSPDGLVDGLGTTLTSSGSQDIILRSFDTAGNWAWVAKHIGSYNGQVYGQISGGYSCENPPPNTVITGQTISASQHKASFTFKGSGGAGALRFQCKLDSRSWAGCTSGVTYSSLASGSHVFQVRAIDARGLKDPTPAAKSFTT